MASRIVRAGLSGNFLDLDLSLTKRILGLGLLPGFFVSIDVIEDQARQLFLFFFQAEDGIRDYKVTGVQTCALPILGTILGTTDGGQTWTAQRRGGQRAAALFVHARAAGLPLETVAAVGGDEGYLTTEIGRAAGRGRGEILVGAGSLKKKKKDTRGRD